MCACVCAFFFVLLHDFLRIRVKRAVSEIGKRDIFKVHLHCTDSLQRFFLYARACKRERR